MVSFPWKRRAGAFALLPALGLAACNPTDEAIEIHAAGDYQAARDEIMSRSASDKDRLVLLVEQGKICLDAGDPQTAKVPLADASDWCERYAIYEPKTTISEEAAAIAVNQSVRTYRGTYADRIMVDAYAALAFLWIGDRSKAAVYANRVVERQTDAEVEQQKQIAKVSKEMSSYKGGAVNGLMQQVRQAPALRGLDMDAGYSAYLNPFASWMAAIAWSSTGDASMLERARVSLRRALAMAPGNSVLAREVERNPFELAQSRPQVLVLFEAGRGMSLQQLLIPLVTPWTGYSSIPLPIPQAHPRDVAGLTISGEGVTVRTETLSDNDAIFMAQYHRMLPEILFRTAVMIAAKEAATVAAVQSTRDNDGAQIAILAGMSLYKALTNQADIRSWRSVGQVTQIAQLDRPGDGVLSVTVQTTSGASSPPATVPLPPGRVVMLYVRSIHPGSTAIYPFTLAPDAESPEQGSSIAVGLVPAESNAPVVVRKEP